MNNAFEYLKSGSRIVDDGKSNIFTYCINAGVLNLAGGVLNSMYLRTLLKHVAHVFNQSVVTCVNSTYAIDDKQLLCFAKLYHKVFSRRCRRVAVL